MSSELFFGLSIFVGLALLRLGLPLLLLWLLSKTLRYLQTALP
jgi:hypothetical protein